MLFNDPTRFHIQCSRNSLSNYKRLLKFLSSEVSHLTLEENSKILLAIFALLIWGSGLHAGANWTRWYYAINKYPPTSGRALFDATGSTAMYLYKPTYSFLYTLTSIRRTFFIGAECFHQTLVISPFMNEARLRHRPRDEIVSLHFQSWLFSRNVSRKNIIRSVLQYWDCENCNLLYYITCSCD